jgi:hypothetical protein
MTIVTIDGMGKHYLRPDCDCIECTDIDWDAPCPNCLDIGSASGRPQRDCCGCHQPEHDEDCEHYGIED